MNQYSVKRVNTPEEYLAAIEEGYLFIASLNDVLREVINILRNLKDKNDFYLYHLANAILEYSEYEGDYQEVLEIGELLLKRKPEMGHHILGCLYQKKYQGNNRDKSFTHLLKAVELHFVPSYAYLANCYRFGIGTDQDYKAALKVLNEGVKYNCFAIYNSLGIFYYYGLGIPADRKTAFEYFEKGHALGSLFSCYFIGRCYYFGNPVARDYQKAFQYLSEAASFGQPRAMVYLGILYHGGMGVDQNYQKAAEWYQKAADYGDTEGITYLGNCYAYGEGVPLDENKAFSLFEKAAQLGDGYGQYRLSYCYHEGLGTEKDLEKAFYWCKQSAEQEYGPAQSSLGDFYRHGDGVDKNMEEAMRWYALAAENGDENAQYNLGVAYEFGQDSIKKDLKKAIYWYRKSADQENDLAQRALAAFYLNGKGVKKDYKKAFYWFKKSAENGNVDSMNSVGYCYYNGYGAKQSYKNALIWFRKGAEYDEPYSLQNLGMMYTYGQAVEKDEEKAFYYYKKSADNGGNDTVEYSVARHYYHGIGVKQSYTDAFYWGKKAADHGNEYGQFLLGMMYEFARGVDQSFENAFIFYEKAAKQGLGVAQGYLAYFYENGTVVKKDLNKALELYESAFDKGETGFEEDIERVKKEIENSLHASLKVAKDVDIFISWNHHNLDFKNKLKDELNNHSIKVWESDESAEGNLDLDVRYAIEHSKGYLILLSKEALSSTYMPVEIDGIFDRIKKQSLSKTIIKVFVLGDSNQIIDAINNLPGEGGFKRLLELTSDFSENAANTIAFAKKVIRETVVVNYQERVKNRFEVFPITLSDIVSRQNNENIIASLDFESGYINRDLHDDSGRSYGPDQLLNIDDTVLIFADGGAGKSLYIKNLLRTKSKDDKFFFYLPCSLIKKEIKTKADIEMMELIHNVAFKMVKYDEVSIETIYDVFRNENRSFYLIIDALDEADEYKNTIIEMANEYQMSASKDNIHLIFTSRSKNDASVIVSKSNKKVVALSLSELSDEDIVKMFDSIYQRNYSGDHAEGLTRISKDIFVKSLSLIAPDIKKNPLLISNLIYVYFATRELQIQKSFILEKSSDILVNSLEEERDVKVDFIKELNIDINELLEYVAFRVNVNNQTSLEDSVKRYLETANKFTTSNVESICAYLRRRRIIIGNNLSHNIYSSFFAAKYIFHKVYFFDVDDDFGNDVISFGQDGKDKLQKYIEKYFASDLELWPDICINYLGKLDYEIHAIYGKNKISESDVSYITFVDTLSTLSSQVGQIAYQIISDIASKDNIVYYPMIIRQYFKKA